MSSPSPPTHRITRHSTPLRRLRLFHPTIVHLHPTTPGTKAETSTDGDLAREKSIVWSSRKARKGRYAPRPHHIHDPHAVHRLDSSTIPSSTSSPSPHISPDGNAKLSSSDTKSLLGTAVIRLQTVESEFKPHLDADVSFWIAVFFTFGSVVWVVNGFLVLLPLYLSSLNSTTYFRAAAATAFLGGSIFEIGSYLMVVEALNRGRESNFGASLYHLAHPQHTTSSKSTSSNDTVQLHQRSSKSSSSEKTVTSDDPEKAGGAGRGQGRWIDDTSLPDKRKFIWWGKPQWHDIGYAAAFVQLCAASIFWVATLTGLPGVISGFPSSDPSVAITDVFFWTPQVLGGTGFIISALLLMLEVQTKWWKPALGDIGWHIGFWNLVGAVGFMICGAFGYSPVERWVEQSALSTFWGSWAFLIGSVMQLYEVIWREPPPVPEKGDKA